jgi:hypothetical protein
MSSAASQFSLMHGGKVAVVLAPYVSRRLADDGWTRRQVKLWLYENGRVASTEWEHWWGRKALASHQWPKWVTSGAGQGAIPVVESPDDISLIIAGGDLHIPQHAYVPTWGFPPCRITRQLH